VFILSFAMVSQALSSRTESRTQVMRTFISRGFLIPAAIVVALLVSAFAIRPQIASQLWSGAISGMISQSEIEDLPDGLHVGLAGTGAPMPDAQRVGQSTFVIAGKHLFIIDSGPGSTLNLERMKVPIETADAILLTHFHSDHIGDLGELLLKSWTYGARTEPMLVIGPEGVESVVEGFNMAFAFDAEYRYAHHGDVVAPTTGAGGRAETITGFGDDESTVIFQTDDLTVTAFLVDHRPVKPAVGYRFDYKDRSVLVSGDTFPSESLMRQAEGVDLLIHETANPDMLAVLNRAALDADKDIAAIVANDILTYHTFPEETARIARDANAGSLVMTHILPPMPASILHPLFLGDSKNIFDGPITIAYDGMLFSLLPDTIEIERQWLLR